jgi:hypothetical protein
MAVTVPTHITSGFSSNASTREAIHMNDLDDDQQLKALGYQPAMRRRFPHYRFRQCASR